MKRFLPLFLLAASVACAQVVIPWTDVDKTGAKFTDLGTIGAGLALTGNTTLSANVVSVAGRTGNVTLTQSDITGLKTTDAPTFANLKADAGAGTASATLSLVGRSAGTAKTATLVADATGNVTLTPAAAGIIKMSGTSGDVLQLRNGSDSGFSQLVIFAGSTDQYGAILSASTAGVTSVGSKTNHPFRLLMNAVEVARFATSGNLLLGSTTDDGVNRFQVTGSAKISGTVGIGASPYSTEALRVNKTGANGAGSVVVARFSTDAQTNNDQAAITFNALNNLSTLSTFATIGGGIEDITNGYGFLSFSTLRSGSVTERGRFTSAGDFLIGTATDDGANKLQVNGSAKITGALKLTGTNTFTISPGTATSVDNATITANTSGKGMGLSLNPNGTGTFSGVTLSNNSSATDYGALQIGVSDSVTPGSEAKAFLNARVAGNGTIPGTLIIGGTQQAGTNFSSVQIPGGNVSIGGGTAVKAIRSTTATLDFASTASGSASTLPVTVTGAAVGDTVVIVPADGTGGDTGIVLRGAVTAAATVTAIAQNITSSVIDPASRSYRVTVISF